jgi:peptide/nickel transport system substrate-binding protein
MNKPFRALTRNAAVLATLVLIGVGLASCASTGPKTGPTTATFALPVSTEPNYIFPLDSLQYYTFANLGTLQLLLYRPLYWFSADGKVEFNPQQSLARQPTYSNGGKTVTITLKKIVWSDGAPMTSRDVAFWINLLIAEKNLWASYVPGGFPGNLVAESYPNARTVELTFNHAYNHHWLLFNELSQIFPIPQARWDKVSATGSIGNYDRTSTGAVAVYKFLNHESQQLSTYATNPLWQVVDGPWELEAYDSGTGYTAFKRNPTYSGPAGGTVTKFVLQPFSSEVSEEAALRSGTVDYGYIPPSSISLTKSLEAAGYSVNSWPTWTIAYLSINFLNPTLGPAFSQLYVRQALQDVINQPGYIKAAWAGFAYPTYGPIPLRPPGSYLSSVERSNPYPYDPTKAAELLKGHGWQIESGIATCVRAGASSADCGPSVRAGTKLSFNLLYASGSDPLAVQMQLFASSASKVGIDVTLRSAPVGDVLGQAGPCGGATGVSCAWQTSDCGCFWTYYPDFYPTGEEIFAPGAGSNQGSYNNAEATRLIDGTTLSENPTALHAYENYIAVQLPVLWMPTPDYQISVVSNKLHGALPQDPLAYIYPEMWSLSGS